MDLKSLYAQGASWGPWLANDWAQSGIVVVLSALVIALFVRLARSAILQRVEEKDLRYRLSKGIGWGGHALFAVVVIAQFGNHLSAFSVAIGAASAGVAFALQEVITSLAGWIAISLGQFYKVGDRVQLGGIRGDVIDIGLIRTTLMETGAWVDGDLYNGRIVRLANSYVFKEPVFNYSGEFPFLWDEIKVPIKFGSDYEAVRALMLRIAVEVVGKEAEGAQEHWSSLVRRYRIEDANLAPMVTLIATDNWVEFTLRYPVDHRARRSTKDALFTALLREVEAQPQRMGFASTTIQLVEWPRLQVDAGGLWDKSQIGM